MVLGFLVANQEPTSTYLDMLKLVQAGLPTHHPPTFTMIQDRPSWMLHDIDDQRALALKQQRFA
jgi:hypothetical protein